MGLLCDKVTLKFVLESMFNFISRLFVNYFHIQ